MARHPKSLREALLPILIMNWISGMGIIEFPVGKPRKFISIIYVAFFIFGCLYLSMKYTDCQMGPSSSPGSYVLQALNIYNKLIVLISIFYCWYYQKMLEVCIRRIELMDEVLECLGSKSNWSNIFTLGLWTVSLSMVGIMIPYVSSIYWLYSNLTFEKSYFCTLMFYIPVYFMTFVDSTFGIIARCLSFSLRNLNILLERAATKVTNQRNYKNIQKHQKIITFITFAEFNAKNIKTTKNLLQLLKQVHLELSKITWNLNKIYGIQATIVTIAYIIFMIVDSYYLFSSVLGSKIAELNRKTIAPLLCTGSSFIIRLMRVMYVNNVCENVVKQSNKTKEIIFELNRGNQDIELREEIQQFSLQISQRPLQFSMCGLFVLERKFIGSVLTTAITYLVCLIEVKQ